MMSKVKKALLQKNDSGHSATIALVPGQEQHQQQQRLDGLDINHDDAAYTRKRDTESQLTKGGELVSSADTHRHNTRELDAPITSSSNTRAPESQARRPPLHELSNPPQSAHNHFFPPYIAPQLNTTSPASRNRHRKQQQTTILPRPRPSWNPANSTPRVLKPRKEVDIPPELPSPVRLVHPQIGQQGAVSPTVEGDHPLLSLPEQRRSRHSASFDIPRASLQVEVSDRSGPSANRISLPDSITNLQVDKGKGRAQDPYTDIVPPLKAYIMATTTMTTTTTTTRENTYTTTSTTDPEVGPNSAQPRNSTTSGIGPALSTHSQISSQSSIHGSAHSAHNNELEWGPSHPCYPHLNPHVPLSSPLWSSTRIIRIRRDWMLVGDLAPTFSSLYPEILADAGLSETAFREVIDHLNRTLIIASKPWGARNVIDAVLGLATGWLWDDAGVSAYKARLKAVEAYLVQWNQRAEKENVAARWIGLGRTGYLSLDVQIPTPRIGVVEEDAAPV